MMCWLRSTEMSPVSLAMLSCVVRFTGMGDLALVVIK